MQLFRVALLAGLLGACQSQVFRSNGNGEPTCDPAEYDFPEGFVRDNKGYATYIAMLSSFTPKVRKTETPLATRAFFMLDAASWNCVAAYDTDKLDALTKIRPIVEVPETACGIPVHQTGARMQCMIYMFAAAIPFMSAESVETFQTQIQNLSNDPATGEDLGLYPTPFSVGYHPALAECEGLVDDYEALKVCVQDAAADNDYAPSVVGGAIALDLYHVALNDGFNMDGTDNGRCEYNCRPYADTTGYVPENLPGRPVNAYKEKWAPLLEDDGKGFFYRQEHVTPHIGFTGKPYMITRRELDRRKLDRLRIDYREEAAMVVDRMALLDDVIKMRVELFDDKVNLVNLYFMGLRNRYGADFSIESMILFITTITGAELDAVLLAWKEKVVHDRVRTTTVIQERRYRTPDTITTWAGPYAGIQTFAAKEFQPYVRVMPHAEYPSGSGCLCTAAMEATQAFMKILFQDEIEVDDMDAGFVATQFIAANSSMIEPGVTPATDLTFEFTSLQEIRNVCGQSRLDGGMHFTPAVPDSYELCGGFGRHVETYLTTLLNGSTDLIEEYGGAR